MIKLIDITKNYGEKNVFSHFNLNIEQNKITAVLGESGVGKTTLLSIIANKTEFSGKIENAPEKASFVFQEDRLIPFKTVNENLEFVLGKGNFSAALDKAGLNGCENAYPDELSGGMKRRVALLRAFLFESDAIFMDEPFSSLDIGTKYMIMDNFLSMWNEDRRTAVIVTHNQDEAAYIADRAIILGKDGKILFDEKNPYKESKDKRDFSDFSMKITSVFIKNT